MPRLAAALVLTLLCFHPQLRAFQNNSGLPPLTPEEQAFFQQAPFRIAQARNELERGFAFERANDFAGALAAYRSAGDALARQQAGMSVRRMYASAALVEASSRLDEARMMNFLGQKQSAAYNSALLDAKQSAMWLVSMEVNADQLNCDSPKPKGAYFAHFWVENPRPGDRYRAYITAAKVELMQNHLAMAKTCYEKAQEIDPTSEEAQRWIASIDRALPAAANPQSCPSCLTKTQKDYVDAGIGLGAALIADAYPEGSAISAAVLTLINHLLPENQTAPTR